MIHPNLAMRRTASLREYRIGILKCGNADGSAHDWLSIAVSVGSALQTQIFDLFGWWTPEFDREIYAMEFSVSGVTT